MFSKAVGLFTAKTVIQQAIVLVQMTKLYLKDGCSKTCKIIFLGPQECVDGLEDSDQRYF